MYCAYYIVKIEKEKAWFVTAAFKSFEHLAFDRTIDKSSSTFEFFVPIDTEAFFLEVASYFVSIGLIREFYKTENRLILNDFV